MVYNLMLNFYKYQSLGNDFILLDWTDLSVQEIDAKLKNSNWPIWIKQNCDRKYGIGADGVLIIKNKNQPEVLMFNPDGTDGQSCFNGLRCVAYYLVSQKNFPQKFKLMMQRPINCEVIQNLVIINVGKVNYQKPHQIQIADKILLGHIVNVGNPHFVVLEKVDLVWLQKHGGEIEQHQDFPNRTNVEFVWGNKNNYHALIYERGCGITKACGTGAAAIMQTLYQQNKIICSQKIAVTMPGGILQTYLDNDESIIQIAQAKVVFQ